MRYRLALFQSISWTMEPWSVWPINSAVIYVISLGRNLIKFACASLLLLPFLQSLIGLLSNISHTAWRSAAVCAEPVLQYSTYPAFPSVPRRACNNLASYPDLKCGFLLDVFYTKNIFKLIIFFYMFLLYLFSSGLIEIRPVISLSLQKIRDSCLSSSWLHEIKSIKDIFTTYLV